MSLLAVKNLSVNYGNATALRHVNLEVNQGEIVAVIGRNGAGKTTLLKAITGLVKKHGGTVTYKQEEMTHVPAYHIVRSGLVHVPQGRQVFGDQTVHDNLILGGYTIQRDKKKVAMLVEREYERFPRLKERRHQMAGTLSGGEQQMLAVSRALMCDPDMIVLDEPSMGLSPLYVKQIMDTLIELKREGKTILVVEQLAMAALAISDRAYVLNLGQVQLEGDSKELLKKDEVIKSYLGSA